MFAHKSLLKGNSCFIMKKKKGAHYTRKGGVRVLRFLKIPAKAPWIKKRADKWLFLFPADRYPPQKALRHEKKRPLRSRRDPHKRKSPAACYSRYPLGRLPSPLRCLTSVFGMGTGVTTALSPPDFFLRPGSMFFEHRILI